MASSHASHSVADMNFFHDARMVAASISTPLALALPSLKSTKQMLAAAVVCADGLAVISPGTVLEVCGAASRHIGASRDDPAHCGAPSMLVEAMVRHAKVLGVLRQGGEQVQELMCALLQAMPLLATVNTPPPPRLSVRLVFLPSLHASPALLCASLCSPSN